MAKVHTAGVPAQRWLAIGFVTVAVMAVVPLSLAELASGGGVPATEGYTLPARRAVVAAAAVAPAAVPGHVDAHTLLEVLRDHDISLDKVRTGEAAVPRLVMSGMPRGLDRLDNVDDRKDAFVNTMLPLALMVNEEISRDRTRLLGLAERVKAGVALAPQDQAWLNELAARYGMNRDADGPAPARAAPARVVLPRTAPAAAALPADDDAAPPAAEAPAPTPIDIDALLRRVDVVPVSMVLAQAAEESGWGTSRVAQHGNALFGQLTWDESKGIAPRNRQSGESYRYRRFDDLLQSVREYEQNLNTHDAYAKFRATRAALRRKGQPLDSIRLISTLERYSEKGPAYVKSLVTLVRVNNLRDFDQAVLHKEGEPAAQHTVIAAALKRK